VGPSTEALDHVQHREIALVGYVEPTVRGVVRGEVAGARLQALRRVVARRSDELSPLRCEITTARSTTGAHEGRAAPSGTP
jgi:hypothetical protein